MKTEEFQAEPLRSIVVWYKVFEAENPLGWLLLSFILILFNIILFYSFKCFWGPESSESPVLPSQTQLSAGDNEAHISGQQMEKEKQTPSSEIRLHAECLKEQSL